MSVDLMSDILARHADALNKSDSVPVDIVAAVSPNERDQIASLFNVAERAKQVLHPVFPSPAFRARLRDGLMLAAHHQQAHRMLTEKRSETTWGWLIGAAAIGSAAGIMAFVLRLRAHSQRIAPASDIRSS